MSKENVWKLINKKKSFTKAERKKKAMSKGANGIIKEFIQSMDDLREKCASVETLDMSIKNAVTKMEAEMRIIDPDVSLKVLWYNEGKVEKIEDLRVDGVEITWSKFYLGKHPFSEKTRIVDVGFLFVNGYYD